MALVLVVNQILMLFNMAVIVAGSLESLMPLNGQMARLNQMEKGM
jgi:hypothetical protein